MPRRISDAEISASGAIGVGLVAPRLAESELAPTRRASAKAAPSRRATRLNVVIVTLDRHLASAAERAALRLARELPGVTLRLHAAAEWSENPPTLEACKADLADADIIVANMLFMDEHVRAILPSLEARRDNCDALHCSMSTAEVVRLTKLGGLDMSAPQGGLMSLLKRLRGGAKKDGNAHSGAKQLAMLKRLPAILRFIPGKAQDLRAYFLGLQYCLAGSDTNIENLVRLLVDRYADGARRMLRGAVQVAPPIDYPDVGLYHPRLAGRIGNDLAAVRALSRGTRGTIGLLVMRSYVLAGNSAHYDAVISAFETRGFAVVPAFASGLDARQAIDAYFHDKTGTTIDALVSLTGFSLVGGPAYNDSAASEVVLAKLDVPYVAAQAMEFQSLRQWEASPQGLTAVEATMMVAIPELDGATGPIVFGGRDEMRGGPNVHDMHPHDERIARLADRVARLVALRRKARAERKVAIVLFNFPPNAGNIGTAAFLSVFESLFNTLNAMKAQGYDVDCPPSIDALRDTLLVGNASLFGADANVQARIPVEDHVRRERWLAEIERQWGAAPGRQLTDGQNIFVLGAKFGNVFVGVQPGFGYEGDPMRLLFERGFTPTHAFSAFYRWLDEDFGADAVMHFGTHGALEFMPGKQTGMSGTCWPDRLIGTLPNIYLYAANNPSEGSIAKRRSAATLVSYLTPSVTKAGLYRGLLDLKSSLDRYSATAPTATIDLTTLATIIQAQAAALDLTPAEPAWEPQSATAEIGALRSPRARTRICAHSAWPACRRRADAACRTCGYARRDCGVFAWRDARSCNRRFAGAWRAGSCRCLRLARNARRAGRARPAYGWPRRNRRPAGSARCSLHPPRTRRRSPAHACDLADRTQPARFRSDAYPECLRHRRWCAASGAPSRHAFCPRGQRPKNHRHRALGNRQSEIGRRPDRAGSGAVRYKAALRCLR